MTNKQRIGLILGLGAVAGGFYWWYKNQPPKFKILEFNNRERSIRWQYGNITNITRAGQSSVYSDHPHSDFFVNVGPIEEGGKVVGLHFNFLGKDNREPQFVYFD
jgi:hypothetical protein